MFPETRDLALDHARESFPRESCGLLVIRKGREVYWPCRNIGVGTDQFVIHPEDYVKADEQGQIVAVVHSHPGLPPEPSQADRVACEASGLPWHIVSVPNDTWACIEPMGYVAPLVGRAPPKGQRSPSAQCRPRYRLGRSRCARASHWPHTPPGQPDLARAAGPDGCAPRPRSAPAHQP